MGKRKRTSRRSDLVGRAVSAGRRALKEAESRVPPDLRRQVDRRLKDADKTARAAIKALETQIKRASTRTDVNNVLKRIDGLTKQARQVIRGTGPRRATTTAKRAATRTRKAASTTRRRATRKASTAAKAPSSGGTSRSRPATTRRSAPRRTRTAATAPAVPEVIMEPGPVGEIEVFEVTES